MVCYTACLSLVLGVLSDMFFLADSDDSSIVRLISFNSRGFNESKKRYISGILSDCDILFLQEHWPVSYTHLTLPTIYSV